MRGKRGRVSNSVVNGGLRLGIGSLRGNFYKDTNTLSPRNFAVTAGKSDILKIVL